MSLRSKSDAFVDVLGDSNATRTRNHFEATLAKIAKPKPAAKE
jgi:hypothetical protein